MTGIIRNRRFERRAFMKKRGIGLVLLVLVAGSPAISKANEGRDPYKAMWLSIAHPGLGEWYLRGWGSFEKCPQKKFWLGLVPGYGWPGYLQVKSAIDARHGRTNDDLTFRD
jgi:hypothetical protein